MSNFKNLLSSVFNFDNGYAVHFEPVAGIGTVFTFIFYKGEKVPIGNYMSIPGRNDNYCAFLSAEDFADMLFKVSKAQQPQGINWENVSA